MGAWSTVLYGNDTTCDVRDTYIGLLEKQSGSLEAYEKTMESCSSYREDKEEAPLFWYALAESQWKVGRLMPEVKEKALEWISKEGGLSIWEENNPKGTTGWKKTLGKLRIKLETPQRKEKKFRKIIVPYQNPWELNDVYAYKIFKSNVLKISQSMQDKYILMQKIGEEESKYNSPNTIMRIQIYDRFFDELPSVEDAHDTIKNFRILPLSYSYSLFAPKQALDSEKIESKFKFMIERIDEYKYLHMSMCMEQYHKSRGYPKDELTYLCTIEGINNKQHERKDNKYYNVSNIHNNNLFNWYSFHYNIVADFQLDKLKQKPRKSAKTADVNL